MPLKDRSNRELCISGCRLRLHNQIDINFQTERDFIISQKINKVELVLDLLCGLSFNLWSVLVLS